MPTTVPVVIESVVAVQDVQVVQVVIQCVMGLLFKK